MVMEYEYHIRDIMLICVNMSGYWRRNAESPGATHYVAVFNVTEWYVGESLTAKITPAIRLWSCIKHLPPQPDR
jgi:hypothetical protein